MTITRTPAAEPPATHDDTSWMPISAVFEANAQRIAEEMTTTVESWLEGLHARSVHRRRGGHRNGNGSM